MNKLKLGTYIAAAAVLVGALGYYNFIDKPAVSQVVKGEECPNFITRPFQVSEEGKFSISDEVFTLVDQRGKICVVNLWETWCIPCIQELPEFNEIQEHYAESVEVIAIVGDFNTPEGVVKWMNDEGWRTHDPDHDWREFSMTFGYLSSAEREKLGCTGPLPRTVVVDANGVVAHEQDGSMSYEALETIIQGLL